MSILGTLSVSTHHGHGEIRPALLLVFWEAGGYTAGQPRGIVPPGVTPR
jgi:hypothetical protein